MTTTLSLTAGEEVRDFLSRAGDRELGYAAATPSGTLATTIHVHEIPDLVHFTMVNPTLHDHALCFLGGSAIGKTYAIRQGFHAACAEMGRTPVLHELHVSQMGPTDVMGVPRDDGKGRTVWYPPRIFPLAAAHPDHEREYRLAAQEFDEHPIFYNYVERMEQHPQYGLFFDEVTNPSNPSILHQCFSIWHGKFVADHRLVGDTAILLAGNRVEDRTNSIPLAASATSRLDMVEVIPSLAGWLQSWAMVPDRRDGRHTREHPLVIAFLLRNSDRFSPPTAGVPQMQPYPAPRTWSYVSDLLYAADDCRIADGLLFASIAGRVGDAAARDLWAFRDNYADLPSVSLLLDTDDASNGYGWLPDEWPKRLDILYLLATQMVQRLDEANSARFMRFMLDRERFPREVAVTAFKLLRPAGKLDDLADDWQPELFNEFGAQNFAFIFPQ